MLLLNLTGVKLLHVSKWGPRTSSPAWSGLWSTDENNNIKKFSNLTIGICLVNNINQNVCPIWYTMYQTQWYATVLCVQFFLVKSVCKIAWTVAIDPPQSLVHRVDHRQMDSLDNGLAPNRRQAIIWTNDDPVQRRIYASLGLNELTPNFLLMNCLNIFLSLVVMHFFFPWVGSVVNVSTQFTAPVSYIGKEKVDLQHLILQHSEA